MASVTLENRSTSPKAAALLAVSASLLLAGFGQRIPSASAMGIAMMRSAATQPALQRGPVYDKAVPAIFAPDLQNSSPSAFFSSVSCPTAGNCTAAGGFKDVNENHQAVTETSKHLVWARSAPAVFAAGVQNGHPDDSFLSVSCAKPGYCTAAGDFVDVQGSQPAFTETSKSGVWGKALPVKFASGVQSSSPNAQVYSVSCPSPGNCTAAGSFQDAHGYIQAFLVSSKGGVWAIAVPAKFAAGLQSAHPDASLFSVSCATAGNCAAAGQFVDPSATTRAFTEMSTNGVWARAVPATYGRPFPPALYASYDSISCASPGDCTAAGYGEFQSNPDGFRAFTRTSTNERWGPTVAASIPAIMQTTIHPDVTFTDVSCSLPGNCMAVGFFVNSAAIDVAFTQASKAGIWANPVPSTSAQNVPGGGLGSEFNAVSCAATGNCTAAGLVDGPYGSAEAITQTSPRNGVWSPAVPVTFPLHVQTGTPYASIDDISCASAGNCTAAGSYGDAGAGGSLYNLQAFTRTLHTP